MTSRGLEGSTEQVVGFVRNLIDRGRLRPGDRLPAERDLAVQIGVSRPSVRAGLHALAAMGVVQSRHGSGTYIPDGPPSLGSEPLSFLAALHGFTREEMYEARRILEIGAAGLAAERATSEHLATLSEEVAGLFANRDNPHLFLVHDINFHRYVAEAAKQPDRRRAGRDGLGALLRAPARDRRARLRSRSARRRRSAPANLPGDSRPRPRRGPPRDERSPHPGAALPGAGTGELPTPVRAAGAPRRQTQGQTDLDRMTKSLFDLVRQDRRRRGRHQRHRPRARARARRCRRRRRRHRPARRTWSTKWRLRSKARGRRTLRFATDVADDAVARRAARRGPRGLRAGGHRVVRRGNHAPRADARDGHRRLAAHHRREPDRHAARVQGVRAAR